MGEGIDVGVDEGVGVGVPIGVGEGNPGDVIGAEGLGEGLSIDVIGEVIEMLEITAALTKLN